MIAAKVYADVRATQKQLRILRDLVPQAASPALSRVGQAVITRASTRIARQAKVPRWMVFGVGSTTKNNRGHKFKTTKGGRLGMGIIRGPRQANLGGKVGRSGGKPVGVKVFVREGHINPVGTKHKQNAVKVPKRGKHAGVLTVGGGQYRRAYDDAFLYSKRWSVPVIMRRVDGSLRPVQIEIKDFAVGVVKRLSGPAMRSIFPRRFKHEMNRLWRRHGKTKMTAATKAAFKELI